MLSSRDLWDISGAWRWLKVLTLLSTVLSVLLLLRCSPTVTGAAASYAPPSAAPGMVQPASAAGAASGYSPESQDPVFGVAVSAVTSRFSTDTEVHAVGVYEPAPPPGVKDKPWWSNCTGFAGDSEAMSACHQEFANKRTSHPVTVNLRRGQKPVVLVLMAYEPVVWKVDGADSGNLQEVILAGYHGQDIRGLPDTVPVIAFTHEASPCQTCTRKSGYFYAYEEKGPEYASAVAKIEAYTGLKVASFQGGYKGHLFNISSGGAAGGASDVDSYSDQEFTGSVTLAGIPLMLPEGLWRGVAFQRNAATTGEDQMLVLARQEDDQLSGLYAVRVQTNRQRQGFMAHQACDHIKGYLVEKKANDNFGPQLCQWVTHVTAPWAQPIFSAAADRLTALKVSLPDTVIASGLHKADMASSVSVVYYTNPALKGLRVPRAHWSQSDWHASRLSTSPERQAYVDEQVRSTGFWFQILQASGS